MPTSRRNVHLPGATRIVGVLLMAMLTLAGGGLSAAPVAAKGVGQMAAAGGVTVNGSPYLYAAMSPNTARTLTVVVRTNRDDGRINRWWYLPGTYVVPAVAYDLSGGGLSADGSTLVLSRFSRTYPPAVSRFAILNTRLHLRHPWDPPEHRPGHAVKRVALKGDFSFDAISPDGSTVYLIQRLPRYTGPAYIANYAVRALDTQSGKLLPKPIVDPSEPNERMQGLPITRATSPDGRWAYTLYDGNGGEPFIHALDTVEARAVCIDLPQLEDRRNLFMLKLQVEEAGKRLTVLSGPHPPRELPPLRQGRPVSSPVPHPLLTVDTQSFEVGKPSTAGDGGDSPWLSIAAVSITLFLGLVWAVSRRRRVAKTGGLEHT